MRGLEDDLGINPYFRTHATQPQPCQLTSLSIGKVTEVFGISCLPVVALRVPVLHDCVC